MSAAELSALRGAYLPLITERFALGFTAAQIRGQLAALLVITMSLTRAQALCVARVAL